MFESLDNLKVFEESKADERVILQLNLNVVSDFVDRFKNGQFTYIHRRYVNKWISVITKARTSTPENEDALKTENIENDKSKNKNNKGNAQFNAIHLSAKLVEQ